MLDPRFAGVVSLACHDLRTPLATVYGFARTLARGNELDERSARFVGMIEAAAEQMTELLDQLALLARIEGGRYDAAQVEADTLDLATSEDERIETRGHGTAVPTDAPAMKRALASLAVAAVRHGGVSTASWTVSGRDLALAPVTSEAAPVVVADDARDLGSYVARRLIEHLGGSLVLDGETLRVRL
jgi:signal transduction histidine kinase